MKRIIVTVVTLIAVAFISFPSFAQEPEQAITPRTIAKVENLVTSAYPELARKVSSDGLSFWDATQKTGFGVSFIGPDGMISFAHMKWNGEIILHYYSRGGDGIKLIPLGKWDDF